LKKILAYVSFLTLSLLILNGCQETISLFYHSSLPLAETPTITARQYRAKLTRLGWRVLESRSRNDHIVAVNEETPTSRDLLILNINHNNGDVDVRIQNEMFQDNDWYGPCTICPTYTFSREQEIVRQLRNSH
jgi:hypothetical protein